VGHLPGQRQRVQTGEGAAGTAEVVAGHGDLGVAHAVADDQDDDTGSAGREGAGDDLALVPVEASGAAVLVHLAVRGAVDEGEAAVGDDRRGRDAAQGRGSDAQGGGPTRGGMCFLPGGWSRPTLLPAGDRSERPA
jgi:hypothetical protein